MEHLKESIRTIPNFPKEGIMFKDITTLLQDPKAFGEVIDRFAEEFKDKGIEVIVGAESRGFIFGAPLALKLGCSFVPIRKPGKLPAETTKEEYELEYGTDALEIHTDAIKENQKVLLIDDLLATGGTMEAACKLVKKLKGDIVGIAFLIELSFLKGKEKFSQYPVYSMLTYDGE